MQTNVEITYITSIGTLLLYKAMNCLYHVIIDMTQDLNICIIIPSESTKNFLQRIMHLDMLDEIL